MPPREVFFVWYALKYVQGERHLELLDFNFLLKVFFMKSLSFTWGQLDNEIKTNRTPIYGDSTMAVVKMAVGRLCRLKNSIREMFISKSLDNLWKESKVEKLLRVLEMNIFCGLDLLGSPTFGWVYR